MGITNRLWIAALSASFVFMANMADAQYAQPANQQFGNAPSYAPQQYSPATRLGSLQQQVMRDAGNRLQRATPAQMQQPRKVPTPAAMAQAQMRGEQARINQRWARLQQEYNSTLRGRRVPAKYSSYQDDPFGAILNNPTGQEGGVSDPFGERPNPNLPGGQPFGSSPTPAFAEPPASSTPVQDPNGPPQLPGEIPQNGGGSALPIPTPVDQTPEDNGTSEPKPDYPPGSVTPPGDNTPTSPRPSQYGQPSTQYGQPSNQYGQPSNQYGQPASPYMQPGQQYNQPTYQDPMYNQPVMAPNYPADNYGAPQYSAPQYQPAYSQPPIVSPSVDPSYSGQNVYQGVAPIEPPIVGVYPGDGSMADCQGCDQFNMVQQCTAPQFYLGLFGGISNDPELNPLSGADPGVYGLDDGTIFGAALGRRQGRNLRSELEFAYRSYDGENFTLGGATTPMDGSLDVYSGMLNAYWDFKALGNRCFTPYVGAGVGFSFFDAAFDQANAPITTGDDDDSTFAYQFMFGVNYNMYQTVNLFVEYRKFFADDLTITGTPGFRGDSDRYDFESGDIVAGVRFKF